MHCTVQLSGRDSPLALGFDSATLLWLDQTCWSTDLIRLSQQIAFSVKLNMLLARSCCYSFFFFSFLLGTISSAGERSEVGVTPSSLVAVAGSPESVA